jgi:hypothetical protein
VTLVRTDVSEERRSSIIRVSRIIKLRTSDRSTLRRNNNYGGAGGAGGGGGAGGISSQHASVASYC